LPMLPVSLPEKANVMEVDLVVPALVTALLFPSVAEVMEVFGGTVSTVQLNEAGDEPLFPTLSSDNTLNVWVLSFNDLGVANRVVQVTELALSVLHSKCSMPIAPVPVEQNLKAMEVVLVLSALVTALL